MYNQTRITLKNALETFENILKDMQTDLEKYANNPKYNEKVAFFKRMQINNLQSVCTVFAEFANDANNEIEELTKTNGKHEANGTKYQACCLYHGITLDEVNRFLKMRTNEAILHVEYSQKENFKQMPQFFCSPISTLKPLIRS